MVGIGIHAQAIQKLVAMLPFGSDAARDINEALNKIRKYAKGDGASSGVEKSAIDQMQINARQNAMRMAQLRQAQAQMAGQQAGGSAPPAVMAQQQG